MLRIFCDNTDISEENFTIECKKALPKRIREYTQYADKFRSMYYAFVNSKGWLKKFKGFKNFCDFFKLTGSFVDKNYNVIRFAPLYPFLPKRYALYATKNIDAISKRTRLILKDNDVTTQ